MSGRDPKPGTALVPVAGPHAPVTGTLGLADGELVVRVRPSQVRDATVSPVHTEAAPDPDTLSALGFMRYMGPLTPEQVTRWHAEFARWSRPWWRRWLP